MGGLRGQLTGARVTWPTREVFAFTLPLLTADVAGAFIQSAGALALGTLHDLDKVAVFTAAVPLANLNQVVMRNFTLLYTPAASRLFARGDYASINELYWRTAVWMAILTLPIFAVTFATAHSMTLLLYGTRYEEAGTVLALLSLGEYVNAALGFNGLTLRVLNKVRYVVTINFLAAIVALVANLLLVPRFGVIGAAVATSVTMILHNIFKQAGLRLAAGISLFDARYSGLYTSIALCAGLLVLTQWLMPGRPIVVVSLACAVSFVTLMYSRRLLMVSEMFPEILRVPILRAILA
jgi:O-antigen/teichoic acid export membrane protein